MCLNSKDKNLYTVFTVQLVLPIYSDHVLHLSAKSKIQIAVG